MAHIDYTHTMVGFDPDRNTYNWLDSSWYTLNTYYNYRHAPYSNSDYFSACYDSEQEFSHWEQIKYTTSADIVWPASYAIPPYPQFIYATKFSGVHGKIPLIIPGTVPTLNSLQPMYATYALWTYDSHGTGRYGLADYFQPLLWRGNVANYHDIYKGVSMNVSLYNKLAEQGDNKVFYVDANSPSDNTTIDEIRNISAQDRGFHLVYAVNEYDPLGGSNRYTKWETGITVTWTKQGGADCLKIYNAGSYNTPSHTSSDLTLFAEDFQDKKIPEYVFIELQGGGGGGAGGLHNYGGSGGGSGGYMCIALKRYTYHGEHIGDSSYRLYFDQGSLNIRPKGIGGVSTSSETGQSSSGSGWPYNCLQSGCAGAHAILEYCTGEEARDESDSDDEEPYWVWYPTWSTIASAYGGGGGTIYAGVTPSDARWYTSPGYGGGYYFDTNNTPGCFLVVGKGGLSGIQASKTTTAEHGNYHEIVTDKVALPGGLGMNAHDDNNFYRAYTYRGGMSSLPYDPTSTVAMPDRYYRASGTCGAPSYFSYGGWPNQVYSSSVYEEGCAIMGAGGAGGDAQGNGGETRGGHGGSPVLIVHVPT